jgi:hypothetical protein
MLGKSFDDGRIEFARRHTGAHQFADSAVRFANNPTGHTHPFDLSR